MSLVNRRVVCNRAEVINIIKSLICKENSLYPRNRYQHFILGPALFSYSNSKKDVLSQKETFEEVQLQAYSQSSKIKN